MSMSSTSMKFLVKLRGVPPREANEEPVENDRATDAEGGYERAILKTHFARSGQKHIPSSRLYSPATTPPHGMGRGRNGFHLKTAGICRHPYRRAD